MTTPCSFFLALFNFMKHVSNYGKVPFEQFDTSILTFLIICCYKKVLTTCSWSAHILMKSALLTRNPWNKYLRSGHRRL